MKLNIVKYQDPATRTYLGSPGILRLEDGRLLATHDYFGPGSPRNHENEEHLTSVYRSDDNGRAWFNLAHIANAFWSSLFVHRGAVYLLGCSQQYGSIVIRRSLDGGNTWSFPRDEQTGLLFLGGNFYTPPNYHCAPVPVLVAGGRLYRAFEDNDPCRWPTGFRACVISCREDSDLLEAKNWTMSNKLPFEARWVPGAWRQPEGEGPGWLEGNVVEAPGGEILNILRVHSWPEPDKAAIVRVHDSGKKVTFDPEIDFIDFPGGHTKFTIRYDPHSRFYITLSNYSNARPWEERDRNFLSLSVSRDLRQWRLCKVLLSDDTGRAPAEAVKSTGFQYVDWQFDGGDIIYLSRTAWNGAHNFHDANYITFHRLKNFRSVLPRG